MKEIEQFYSLNFDQNKRSKRKIKYLVFHYTGMKTEKSAIKRLTNFNSKVSCHYFIKKNGSIINLVPDQYISWHAGISSWKKLKNLNKYSIGIEIQNSGHDNKYEDFSSKQILSIKKLLKKLIKKYNINLDCVLGHSDIAPERKKDPGEKFPWKKIAKFNLAKWHKLSEKKIKIFRFGKLDKSEDIIFLKNLYSLGYNKIKKLDNKSNKRFLFLAFQRRFRPSLVDGKSDMECLMISKNLLKS